MEHTEQLFLQALRAALRGQTAEPAGDATEADWQAVFALAQTHKVLPLVYEAVYPLPGLRGTAAAAAARRRVMGQVAVQTRKTAEFLALYRQLQAAGLQPLVVKGIVCRSLYPKPDLRPSGDEDLLAAPGTADACRAVLEAYGLQAEPGTLDAYETAYRKPDGPLYVELHRSLFPPEAAAYGAWNRFFEDAFRRAVPQTLPGGTVYTLCPTDHLFYLLCHAFKHFLHSGVGIRQVCDILLFAERYAAQLDWETIAANCRAIRAEGFAAALFCIGQEQLGVPLPAGLPPHWQTLAGDTAPLLADLLCSGLYGDSSVNPQHSSNITLNAVQAQQSGKKAAGLAASLFPAAQQLEGSYPYLKQHPWLLPAAWAQRLWQYGTKTLAAPTSPAAALKIGEERLELLRQYGVIDR